MDHGQRGRRDDFTNVTSPSKHRCGEAVKRISQTPGKNTPVGQRRNVKGQHRLNLPQHTLDMLMFTSCTSINTVSPSCSCCRTSFPYSSDVDHLWGFLHTTTLSAILSYMFVFPIVYGLLSFTVLCLYLCAAPWTTSVYGMHYISKLMHLAFQIHVTWVNPDLLS